MKLTVGLTLDLGNSETRVQVMVWKKAYRFRLSNKFAVLEPGASINKKYTQGGSTIFEHNGQYIANGDLVEMEYSSKFVRPDGITYKTHQDVTYYSIKLAMFRALELLSGELKQPLDQLDVDFKVSLLLPPLEHDIHEKELEKRVSEINRVFAVAPIQMDKSFIVSSVVVYAEGVASFFGAFYKEKGSKTKAMEQMVYDEDRDVYVIDNGDHVTLAEVDANRKFEDGIVLVLDIGEGTTDMIVFKNMEFIEDSKETIKRGGRAVSARAGKEIRRQYGFLPTEERVVNRIVAEGYLEEGSMVHDVAPILESAKSDYAKEMMNDINNYLIGQSLSPRELRGLLVTGGGALPTLRHQGETPEVVSNAMSKHLIDHISKLSPNIELVNTFGKDLRMLNLDGLVILHKNQ